MNETIHFLFLGFNAPEAILSINRVVLGVVFTITGFHKCFYPQRHEVFCHTLKECGIPDIPLVDWFVCSVELLGGLALVIGLLAPLAALGLLGIAVVAVVTNGIYRIPNDEPEDLGDWVFYFLYLPEVLWVVMLLVVIIGGPGWFSLDHYISTLI